MSNIQSLSSKTVKFWKNFSTQFATKTKGTFIERAQIYMRMVGKDYAEVGRSVQDDIKTKPFKSAVFFTGAGLFFLLLKTNPTEKEFYAKFIQCSNDLSLVHKNLVNPVSNQHLQYIQKCYNTDLIRYRSLGLFSLIWIDKYGDQCDTYENNCSYLQVNFQDFFQRIIDVGFLNNWWVISRKMLDYDINY